MRLKKLLRLKARKNRIQREVIPMIIEETDAQIGYQDSTNIEEVSLDEEPPVKRQRLNSADSDASV